MRNFKEYFFTDEVTDKTLPATENSNIYGISKAHIFDACANTAFLVNGKPFTKAKKHEFSEKTAHLVHNPDFIGELSDSIGTPKDGETEDDFVERAKSSMEKLLREKLEQ